MSDEQEAVPPTTDKLVKAYIKMRNARSQLKEQYEAEDAKIKEQMGVLEQHFLELCKTTGASSIRTTVGTIIRGVESRYWTSDWESMHSFIRENDALDLLERRIAQKAMGEFIKNNPDKLPKGLNVNSEYKVTIRKA
jgi:hypothetical protein